MGFNESNGWGMIEPSDDQKADIALNAISTYLGAVAEPVPDSEEIRTRTGVGREPAEYKVKIPGRPGYKALANEIKRKVCAN
jgi:hypothetical protein